MGFEVEIHPDHAMDSAGRKFGFWNIAAVCSKEPQTAWKALIAEHLKRVLAGFIDDPFPFPVGCAAARLENRAAGTLVHPPRLVPPGAGRSVPEAGSAR